MYHHQEKGFFLLHIICASVPTERTNSWNYDSVELFTYPTSFDLHEDVSAASLIMTLTLLLVITNL